MGNVSHLSKIAIQEVHSEANLERDRATGNISYSQPVNADVADGVFYVANRPWRVAAVRTIFSTAGNDAGAVNVMVKKQTGTQAPDAGVNVLSASVDLKGTANTVVASTLTSTAADKELAVGDRLSADFTGVLTALAGLCISVDLIPI